MSALPWTPERRRANGECQRARRGLALDEGTWRALLERVTGRRSVRECTAAQLAAVADECRRLGWRPRPRPRTATTSGTRAMRARAVALWIALHHLTAVEDPSDAALARYAARMTRSPSCPDGIERLEWLDAAGWSAVIDGLHGWCERIGYRRATEGDRQRMTAERIAWGRATRGHLGARAQRRRGPVSGATAAKVLLAELLLSRAQHAGVGVGLRALSAVAEYAPDDTPLATLAPSALDRLARRLGAVLREAS